jgi:hypothetical protein
MALEVVVDERRICRDGAKVSINPKLSRIVLNKKAIKLIEQNCSKQLTHVQLLIDSEIQDAFWVKPCEPIDFGARKIDTSSGSSLVVGCRLLLRKLKWHGEETRWFPVVWDAGNNAAKIKLGVALAE